MSKVVTYTAVPPVAAPVVAPVAEASKVSPLSEKTPEKDTVAKKEPVSKEPAKPAASVKTEKPAPTAKPKDDGGKAQALLEGKSAKPAAGRAVIQVGAFSDAAKVREVRSKLEQAGLSSEQATSVLELAALRGSTDEILSQLDRLVSGVELGGEGVARLRALTSALEAAGVSSEHYRIDVSIARGLDYYTGVVFETTLGDLPSIGSVCSGGRYDNLAGLYTKQHLPGIGASLGLDRLLAALEQLGRLPKHSSAADVFIALFDPTRLNDYFRLASIVRNAGYSAEVYPDGKKLAQQLKYADQRGFRVALIAGSDELERGTVQVKDLVNKISTEVSWRDEPVKLSHAVETILRLSTDDLIA